MRNIFELSFDACYLASVFSIGIILLSRRRQMRTGALFGAMALVLGIGDLFHLAPRMYGLLGHPVATATIGLGTLITSITSTTFYLLLYAAWKRHYRIRQRPSRLVWGMAGLRVLLCLMPQNHWLSGGSSPTWGALRNLPFLGMGILIIFLFLREERQQGPSIYRHIPLAIALSFLCYIPVVLLAGRYPVAGMLMIPKTLAYLWILVPALREVVD